MKRPMKPKDQLSAHGLSPKKSWGQNFLNDPGVLTKIAEGVSLSEGMKLVELGAGTGALTDALLAQGHNLLAIEGDPELLPVLAERFEGETGLEFRHHDALTLRYDDLAQELSADTLFVAGNLPYNIGSRIIVDLSDAEGVGGALLMVQEEVAERMYAKENSKAFGLLSVLVQRRFRARTWLRVPPGAFFPPPKVHSQVVRLDAHRRKKLSKNLKPAGISAGAFEAWRRRFDYPEGVRAENVSLAAWAALAEFVA